MHSMLTNLDMDVLRTLQISVEAGNFTKAAARIGRSQSAVSLQIDKLERQVGRPLFHPRRAGNGDGGLRLTETGQIILDYARRILELNDEAVATARGAGAEGTVRLGITQDLAETWLPVALARFARTHPGILVETTVNRGAALLDALDQEALDIALVFSNPGGTPRADCRWRSALPITWIGPVDWKLRSGEIVPLVVFEPPCLFRNAAQVALETAGISSRVVFQSPSLAGLWSAVAAGLGVTIRTPLLIPAGLCALKPKSSGLPALPKVEFAMHVVKTPAPSGSSHIADVLVETLEASVRSAAM